nr:hypothetical protein [uncultured Selenomonas sp.]
MSKWTDIRDNIVRELHIDNVTEEIKQRVSASIVSEVLPPIEDAVNKFVATIREQAKEERGWCYWRDAIVLPTVMQGTVWLVKLVLTKTLTPTEQA